MNTRSGMTVMEIIVVVGISSLVMTALVRFITIGFPISKITYLQLRSTETARLQLKRLARSIRELRPSDAGDYPLVEVGPLRLIFFANIDADVATERVRYELKGDKLERGVTKPQGSPAVYNVATEVTTVVASGVRNGATPIFTYYNGNYPTDATPLSSAGLTIVKYIQFYLLVDVDPNADPPPVEVRSQVQLRNLKTNLGQ